MDPSEIQRRWEEVNAELAQITSAPGHDPNNPGEREEELLGELDRLEYEAGMLRDPS